jgi:hypothetical protein
VDDDEEECSGVPSASNGTYCQTKNEIVVADIMVPDVEEVGPEEELQMVGEIMSIIGNVAVVKGTASEIAGRGAEGALDSGTLLVFDDRKVLGYVSVFCPFGAILIPYASFFRFTRHLDLHHSPCIRSSSTAGIHLTPKKFRYLDEYYTYLNAVNLYSLVTSSTSKGVMRATFMMKNPQRTNWNFQMTSRKPLSKAVENESEPLSHYLFFERMSLFYVFISLLGGENYEPTRWGLLDIRHLLLRRCVIKIWSMIYRRL